MLKPRIPIVLLLITYFFGCDPDEKKEFIVNPNSAWEKMTNDFGHEMNSLVSINDKMFAGSYYGGLFVSTDSAHTWSSIVLETQFTPHVNSIAVIDNNILVCTDYTIYRSTDLGITWSADSTFLKSNAIVIECKNIASIGNKHFVALQVVGGSNIASVFYSTDSGLNWSPVSTNQHFQEQIIVANGGNLVMSGVYGGPVFSTDSAVTWHVAQTNIPSPVYVTSLLVWGGATYAGTDERGVYRAFGYPNVWSPVNTGLETSAHVYSIAANDTNIFISTTRLFKSLNGQSWNALVDTLASAPSYMKVIGSYLFATNNNEIWRARINELH